MGITTKRIKDTNYVYFTHYDKGARSTKYQSCGPASIAESMAKAIKMEREYLKRRRDGLLREASDIQAKLDEWSRNQMQPADP